jgi:hypothetical protein
MGKKEFAKIRNRCFELALIVFTMKIGLLRNNNIIYITVFNHEIDAARYCIYCNEIFLWRFFSRNIIVILLTKGFIVNPTSKRLE